MHDQIAKYRAKLISDNAAQTGRIAFAAQDDIMISDGEPILARLAESVLARLNCLALVAAVPSLPFTDFLHYSMGSQYIGLD